MFVDTVDMKIKAHSAFNAMFVDTVDTGVCGSVHNTFIQLYYASVKYCIDSVLVDPCNCVDSVDMYSIDGMVEKP